jgi:cysteine-rich repeat protein
MVSNDSVHISYIDGNNVALKYATTALMICGNGTVEPAEQCDDGNNISGDGCNAACIIEFCGDGILQVGLGEQCDDGNTVSGDGCSATCQSEVIIVLSPNGGEIIPSGSNYNIQWSAPPEAVRFDIGYSLDDGASGTWKLIASNITDYSYNWTVPSPDGNKNTCRVGVRGYNASGAVVGTDTSDNPFKTEVVKLTYPNGGETLISGNTYQITWQTNSTIRAVQSVQIYGSPNEGQPGTWRLLTTVSGNPGFYDWTVPIVGIAQGKCRLGLRLLDSALTPIGQDVGDGNFTVQP